MDFMELSLPFCDKNTLALAHLHTSDTDQMESLDRFKKQCYVKHQSLFVVIKPHQKENGTLRAMHA